jgi:hypothetical protein
MEDIEPEQTTSYNQARFPVGGLGYQPSHIFLNVKNEAWHCERPWKAIGESAAWTFHPASAYRLLGSHGYHHVWHIFFALSKST